MNRFTTKIVVFLPCFFLVSFLFAQTKEFPAGVLHATTDSTFQMPSGSRVIVPAGWYAMKKGEDFILQDPDRQIFMVLAEKKEITGFDAINTVVQTYDPNPAIRSNPTKVFKDRFHREIYEAPYYMLNPKDPSLVLTTRSITAYSNRGKGGYWQVVFVDGVTAAVDRRTAQIDLIDENFRQGGLPERSAEGPGAATASKAPPLDEKFFKEFEEFTRHVMEKTKVPGASVAIVKDGKIIYEKGLGVRELGKNDPVTPQTIFLIASMTKPLTSLLMAKLVDEKKIAWDTPVSRLLPAFQLATTKMTKSLTIQHTVCACTGLPRQDMDFIFERGDTTPEIILEKMRTMAPTTGFGETFQYSNIMVAAGGYIAAHAAEPSKPLGQAYDEAMQTYVFGPLGMKDTTFDFQVAQNAGAAVPHGTTVKTDFTPIPYLYNDGFIPYRPAAGAWSTVEDLAKYLSMEMAGGIGPDGKRVVSQENLMRRRQPSVMMSARAAYGLGLMLEDLDGVKVIGHGGNAIGYTSQMDFLPDYGVGLILLCNADQANTFTGLVEKRFAEMVAGQESHTQADFDLSLLKNRGYNEGRGSFYENESRFTDWVKDYEGDYYNETIGRVSIRMTEEGGILDMGKWKSGMAKIGNDNGDYEFILTTPPLVFMDFMLKDHDGQKTLTYKEPQHQYVFYKLDKAPKGTSEAK